VRYYNLPLFFSERTHFLSDKIPCDYLDFLELNVLMDGIEVFMQGHEDSENFKEDKKWLMDDNSYHPFSFIHLCRQFSIEPKSLRRALVAYRQ
jgi:hypothetical protein